MNRYHVRERREAGTRPDKASTDISVCAFAALVLAIIGALAYAWPGA